MKAKGFHLVTEALLAHGVTDFFYIVGGPTTQTMQLCVEKGIRGIDVRDERGATFAAVAYSRVARRPGVVMACSGPGTTNIVTGAAHAFADGAPVVIIGGSTALFQRSTGAFQETDQVGLFRPITKWSHQVPDTDGIPDVIARAFQIATTGAPGPVYLDFPAETLYGESSFELEELSVPQPRPVARGAGDPVLIASAVDLIEQAERPVVIAGSGVLWSEAWEELKAFVDASGAPFYTTPMATGLIAEDHPLSFPAARSTAFRDTDCMIVVGTRDNYVLNFLQGPVMNADASLIELNIQAEDLSRNRLADVAIVADAKLGLAQLTAEIQRRDHSFGATDWTSQLAGLDAKAGERSIPQMHSDETPIHPFRLAYEIDKLLSDESVFVLDGNDTLAFGRRARTTHRPAGLLTPGVYGTMGVGVPFGLGAKVADPSRPVLVLTGDGAFGYHMAEVDTAVRHGIGFVIVIVNNGGWTFKRDQVGYGLEYSDYHYVAEMFGGWGTKVTDPGEIVPALTKALDYAERESKPAIVNVITASLKLGGRPAARHSRGEGEHGAMDAV